MQTYNREYPLLKRLLQSFKIHPNLSELKQALIEHPYSGSIQSITDTLAEYSVESMAVKIAPEQLEEIPYPALAQIQNKVSKEKQYLLIKGANKEYITYSSARNKVKKLPLSEFLKQWTGITILISDENKTPSLPEIRWKEPLKQIISFIIP